MTIKALELTHFGGLAKVLIPQPTEIGAFKNSDTLYALTMQYLTQELKICVKEKRSDIESGFGYEELIEKPIINFETDHPFGFHKEHIVWRTSVWNLAINRNFEIWKTLSTTKLENSIGELTDYAKKSLKGKLGAGNKKYFEKDKSNKWTFIKFKETKYENVFKPFSDQAIGKCRERARGK